MSVVSVHGFIPGALHELRDLKGIWVMKSNWRLEALI